MSIHAKSESFPTFRFETAKEKVGYIESWNLKINHRELDKSLLLGFNIFTSNNGFSKVAETFFVYQEKISPQENRRIAIKHVNDLKTVNSDETGEFLLGDCLFHKDGLRGQIQSRGHNVLWDLAMSYGNSSRRDSIPSVAKKLGFIHPSQHQTLCDLRVLGSTQIDHTTIDWNSINAVQTYFRGSRYFHSWTHGHCHFLENISHEPQNLLFHGFMVKSRLFGLIPSIKVSSIHIGYLENNFYFDSFHDFLKLRTTSDLNELSFRADRKNLSFRGRIKSPLKDFTGISRNDTDGTLLYFSNSNNAEMRIHVYRDEKLENSFATNHYGHIEIASRSKNPYIPLLI